MSMKARADHMLYLASYWALQEDHWGNLHFYGEDGREFRIKLKTRVWQMAEKRGRLWMNKASIFYSSPDSLAVLAGKLKLYGAPRATS